MGYTHYWERNHTGYTDADLFTAYFVFVDMAKQIIETAQRQGIRLANKWGDEGTEPTVDNGEVSLNGDGEDAHETFVWYREAPLHQEWTERHVYHDFCKTAQKPYDTVVTAMLVAIKEAYGDCVKVHSDGSPSDWEDGLRLFEEATGLYATVPFDKVAV